MNAATKIALSALAVIMIGLALICYGAGTMHSKLGAMVSGLAMVWVGLGLFAAIWRSR